jgi:Pentapeptide repeats (8 copies)
MPPNQEEKPAKPRTRSRKASDQRKEKAAPKRQALPDQASLDQASLDRASLDQASLDQASLDQTGLDQASLDQASLDQASLDQTGLDQAGLEAGTVSPMTAPIEDAPVDIVPAEVVSEAAPADLAPVEAVSIDVAPEAAPVAVGLEKAQEELEKLEGKKRQEEALSGEVLPPEVHNPAVQPSGLSGIALAYGEYTRKSWANGRFLVERLIAARSFDEAIEIQGEFAKHAYANFIIQSERICVLYGEWALGFFRPLEKIATGWPQVGR